MPEVLDEPLSSDFYLGYIVINDNKGLSRGAYITMLEKTEIDMIKLLLVVLICFSTSILMSQNIEYGIKCGVNLSSLDNEVSKFNESQIKIGLNIGAFTVIKINKKMGVRTELFYSMEGANFKGSDEFVRLNRISIPLFFNYALSKKVKFEVGPEFKYQIGFKSNAPSSKGNTEPLYGIFDYGASLGLEYRPIKKIGVSLRNYFGFKYHSKINIDFGNSFYIIKLGRNNVLSFSVNYYLN